MRGKNPVPVPDVTMGYRNYVRKDRCKEIIDVSYKNKKQTIPDNCIQYSYDRKFGKLVNECVSIKKMINMLPCGYKYLGDLHNFNPDFP